MVEGTSVMTTPQPDIRVVPISTGCAEVRLHEGSRVVSIGKVNQRNGRWSWQHRDGETSSPIAENRTDAAAALARYHAAFKTPSAPAAPAQASSRIGSPAGGAPVRRLLFA
jgi:hypothetical protein